jgi:GNAT superfamily N-acetyltransferase
VIESRFIGESLDAGHLIDHFDSGQADLDEWLRRHALASDSRGTGRTFVWSTDGQVVAYYTIAAHLLQRDDLSRSLGRGNPDRIPAVLLAKLALDKTLQGQGLGGLLLADAVDRIVEAARTIAARFIVVDAIDEQAVAFYSRYGFTRLASTNRLVKRMRSARAQVSR